MFERFASLNRCIIIIIIIIIIKIHLYSDKFIKYSKYIGVALSLNPLPFYVLHVIDAAKQ